MSIDIVSTAITVSVVALAIYTLAFRSKEVVRISQWFSARSSVRQLGSNPKDDSPNKNRPWGSKPNKDSDYADV